MLNLIKMISDLRKEVETLRKEVQTLKDALVKQKRDYNDLFYNLDTDNVPKLKNTILDNSRLADNYDGSKIIIFETVSKDGSKGYVEIASRHISMTTGSATVRVSSGDNATAYISAGGNAILVDENGAKVIDKNGEHPI